MEQFSLQTHCQWGPAERVYKLRVRKIHTESGRSGREAVRLGLYPQEGTQKRSLAGWLEGQWQWKKAVRSLDSTPEEHTHTHSWSSADWICMGSLASFPGPPLHRPYPKLSDCLNPSCLSSSAVRDKGSSGSELHLSRARATIMVLTQAVYQSHLGVPAMVGLPQPMPRPMWASHTGPSNQALLPSRAREQC